MAKIYCMNIRELISGNVNVEKEEIWLDCKIDGDAKVRLVFKEDHITRFRYALQKLMGKATETRREKGLPSLQLTYRTKIKRLEYGHDESKKVALIRTWYESGEYQEMVLSETMMKDTVSYLQNTLTRFEAQKNWKN